MSEKVDSVNNENVKKIVLALDKAVPKGSKAYEVVYALCILLAHIFINKREEDVEIDEYLFELKQIIRDEIEGNENN